MEITKNHHMYGSCTVSVQRWDREDIFKIKFDRKINCITGLIILKGDVGKYITIQTQRIGGRWFEASMPADSFNYEANLTPWDVIDFIYKGELTIKGIYNLEKIFQTNALANAVCATKKVLNSLDGQYNDAAKEFDRSNVDLRNRIMAM